MPVVLRTLLAVIALAAAVGAACVDPAAFPRLRRPLTARQTPAITASPASPSPEANATPTPNTRVAIGPAEHDGARTMAHLAQLANGIGPRVSGTAGEDAAIAYVREQFESSGYAVEVMPLPSKATASNRLRSSAGPRRLKPLHWGGAKAGPRRDGPSTWGLPTQPASRAVRWPGRSPSPTGALSSSPTSTRTSARGRSRAHHREQQGRDLQRHPAHASDLPWWWA